MTLKYVMKRQNVRFRVIQLSVRGEMFKDKRKYT